MEDKAGGRIAGDAHGRRTLVDPGPGAGRGAGDALRELERVEMAGAAVDPAAVIDAGAGRRRHLVAIEPLDQLVAVVAPELVDIGPLFGHEAGLVHGLDQPGAPVAVDTVARDQPEGERLGLLGEPPQRSRLVAAELLFEPVLVAALAGVELAAVTPRGAPADAVGLDHDGADPGLGEVERGRQPGIAAADDRDVGPHVLAEPREGGRGIGRRGVERRGVGEVHIRAKHPARCPGHSTKVAGGLHRAS